ncbi:CPBP family intramembrane metalloprotease [Spongiactinospora rosea]|uniref:CPBP family intramembrane metalloprotease n=1 Tax=Spongiactinospora rosea TaxID=2248750 RepID=A0A366LQZ0_9ACTN|nr:CPBP family intramembrane glutamic endopeptidase [Spongiactinospora rosea]RBQ16326.1 CPBP family intramembrane metalloprotease [Spongiactinospora rosea]
MRSRRGDLTVFVLVAFGLAWPAALPLWLGDGLSSSWLPLVGIVMMFTPAIGVLAVWRRSGATRAEVAAATGLGLGPSRRRTLLLILAVWLGTPLVAVLAIALSVATGVLSVDLAGLSMLRGLPGGIDPQVFLIVQVISGLTIGTLITAIPAFGEEWGWRGWLLPHLTERFGVTRGLLISGMIWGPWHAPLTLLGYNYPTIGPWAALYFVGFTVIYGVVIGWLRLYSGSVWPSVVAHSVLNAGSVSLVFLVGDAKEPPDLVFAGISGLVGWAVLAALAAALPRLLPIRRAAPVTAPPRPAE